MLEGRFGSAGATLVIEQRIAGREVSVLAFTDGHRLEVLPAIEDHKTIFDGDRGPNTGGMGTVSPAWISDPCAARIRHEILEPTVRGLAADSIDYRGVLYAGVMVDPAGAPYLLEYNCRFGDPETQPIMARLRGDLGAVLHGAARGEMPVGALGWDARVAVCVVIASHGYPDAPRTGDPITGLDALGDVIVFHAGTARREDGTWSRPAARARGDGTPESASTRRGQGVRRGRPDRACREAIPSRHRRTGSVIPSRNAADRWSQGRAPRSVEGRRSDRRFARGRQGARDRRAPA
jgi:phosphoribosylamine--glycine ligase